MSAAEHLAQLLLVLLRVKQRHLVAQESHDGACPILRQQQEHHVRLAVRSLSSAADVDFALLK
jgi:hypothetical protein